jgi:hypothetical protein
MNVDDLTAKYIELRDRRAKIKKEAEDADSELTKIQDAIADKIKEIMHGLGVKSVKTAHGTAYIAYRESATVADWDVLLDYIQTHEAWDLLERRVSKTGVRERMEEDRNGNYTNPPPPGVNFVRLEGVNVRRS